MAEVAPASADSATAKPTRHLRAYKACDSCRKRKTRCEAISEAPDSIDAPCKRCCRERRSCTFGAPDHAQTAHGPKLQTCDSSQQQDASGDSRRDMLGLTDSPPFPRPVSVEGRSLVSPVMRNVVSSGDDALKILFEAAQHKAPDQLGEQNAHSINGPSPAVATTSTFTTSPVTNTNGAISQAPEHVLKLWSACKFVRQGWLSALEAIYLVDAFYKNLAPFTPILTPYYHDPSNHRELLSNEPILCSTILAISSRYHVLPGARGFYRSYTIHEHLWEHCQSSLTRIILAQEQGSTSRTRTVGTIQALLLWTEWHPRRMRFPSQPDGWDSESLLPPEQHPGANPTADDTSRSYWSENVVSPAQRSGRMSWMLTGAALSLAYEIGIFDSSETDVYLEPGMTASQTQIIHQRRRVRTILCLYADQLSTRLGHRSMTPELHDETFLSLQQSTDPTSNTTQGWDKCIGAWTELSQLVKCISDVLFQSPANTAKILKTGRYANLITHFRPLLSAWKSKYMPNIGLSDSHVSDYLSLEYESARIFTNSLGLQAAIDRMLSTTGSGISSMQVPGQSLVQTVDYGFVQEVVDGGLETLKIAIRLAETGLLRFAPVRVTLRVTSASIHLMKGMGVGMSSSKLQSSLDLLRKCISCLGSCQPDEMHLGTDYATLLEMHVNLLQDKFVRTERPGNLPTRPPSADGTRSRAGHVNATGTATDSISPFSTTHTGAIDGLDNFGMTDEWMTLPADASVQPFMLQDSIGFGYPWADETSLDFIWTFDGC